MADNTGQFGPADTDENQGQNAENLPVEPSTAADLEEVKDDVKKKRRRRRRRRKVADEIEDSPSADKVVNPFAADFEEEAELPSAPPEIEENPFATPNVDENAAPGFEETAVNPFDQPEMPPEEVVSEPQVAVEPTAIPEPELPATPPINPFEEPELPPEEHDTLKKEEYKEEAEAVMNPFETETVVNEPVNPFEMPSNEDTLEKRSLENKPLDRHENVVEEEELEQPDAEEVHHAEEKMDDAESGELQDSDGNLETPENPAEVIEVVSSNEKMPDNDVDNFKEDFWTVLEQAGVGKKQIIGFGIFIGVMVLGLLFVLFGGLNFFKSSERDVNDSDIVVQETVVETDDEQQNSKADGVVSSYIVGLENANEIETPIVATPVSGLGDTAGIDAAFILGKTDLADQARYQYYLTVLRQLQNVYATDVYALVDLAVDRREALENFLADMRSLIDDATKNLEEINMIMTQLDLQFEGIVADREEFEEQYFATTEALLSEASYNNLMNFVEKTKQANELRAYYNAYRFLQEMYVNSLNALNPRYQDIYVNQDAVVQGVRVFDVPSSDIEAIIRLDNE